MRVSKIKLAIYLISIAVFLLLAAIIFRFLLSDRGEPQYITAPVIRADIEDTVLASGALEARQQVNVGAQVSGQIRSLNVVLGQAVKKGQLIAEIDASTQQNVVKKAQSALSQMRAQLRAKQANLIQAKLKFEREQRLRAGDANSRENYEAAEAALQSALADIDSLNEQIDQARITVDTELVNLGYTKILAPMNGTVVSIVTREGQTVNSAQSAPTIVILADLTTMTIKPHISEADVIRVKPGQTVYFTTLGNPERRFYAKLHTVELAPDSIGNDSTASKSTTGTAPVYYNAAFDIPNPDNQLRIAMTVQVSIVLAEAKGALVIPAAALGLPDKSGRYQVQVLETRNGKRNVATRQVKIGIRNVMAQVLDGLRDGEQIVLKGIAAPLQASQNMMGMNPA